MTDGSEDQECFICTMENADERRVVFRDDLWAAEVAPGYEVPGWFILRVRRHAERLTGLVDDELSSFGRRASDLIAAIEDATGAPVTYLMAFGENYRHFHALIVARGDDVPADRRAGDVLKLRLEQADAEKAVELVPAVRRAYLGIVEDRNAARATSA